MNEFMQRLFLESKFNLRHTRVGHVVCVERSEEKEVPLLDQHPKQP